MPRKIRSMKPATCVYEHDGTVRDSKHPTGPALTVTASEWTAFTTGIRTGEFD